MFYRTHVIKYKQRAYTTPIIPYSSLIAAFLYCKYRIIIVGKILSDLVQNIDHFENTQKKSISVTLKIVNFVSSNTKKIR